MEDGAVIGQLEQLVLSAARERRVVTYAEVAKTLGLAPPHTIHQAALLIEQMMRLHAAAGTPQLASLVVSKGRGGLPAPGFFALLDELGLYHGPPDGAEARAFHAAEIARCFAAASV